MRLLHSITNSTNRSLNKLRETVEDRGAWPTAVRGAEELDVNELDMTQRLTQRLNNNDNNPECFLKHQLSLSYQSCLINANRYNYRASPTFNYYKDNLHILNMDSVDENWDSPRKTENKTNQQKLLRPCKVYKVEETGRALFPSPKLIKAGVQ